MGWTADETGFRLIQCVYGAFYREVKQARETDLSLPSRDDIKYELKDTSNPPRFFTLCTGKNSYFTFTT